MTKIAGLTLDNLPPETLAAVAANISHAHVTGNASVSKTVTTVLTANSDRTLTLPTAKGPTSPKGTTHMLIKVDAAGSGKIVLTPASGEKIGSGAANGTWSSPASAVNSIVLVSNGDGTWKIASQSGTWT